MNCETSGTVESGRTIELNHNVGINSKQVKQISLQLTMQQIRFSNDQWPTGVFLGSLRSLKATMTSGSIFNIFATL